MRTVIFLGLIITANAINSNTILPDKALHTICFICAISFVMDVWEFLDNLNKNK